MRGLMLVVCGLVLAGMSGCVDAIEDAVEAAARVAESCGASATEHGASALMPVPIGEDDTFSVDGPAGALAMYANVTSSVPGSADVRVTGPDGTVVFRVQAGIGEASAEGAKEIGSPDQGTYTIEARGTPDGAYGMEVFIIACDFDDA